MRKKTKNRHGGFGLQVLMLLFLLLVGANGAYAQSDCFVYEGSDIIGLTDKGMAASSLTIPATVTTVNSGAFSNATKVSTLIIEAGGNPAFEAKLFGDDKTNPIGEIKILGNSMTVANIKALFESLNEKGELTTVYIAGYSGEWTDITSSAVLTSKVTVTLPAALVSTQQFGDAKVCGRFEITKEIISFCGNATFLDADTDNGSNMLFYIADECNKEEGYIHIQRVRYVKKGEGVLIHNQAGTSYSADLLRVSDSSVTSEEQTLYNKNLLKGVTVATPIEKTDGDKTNLVLSNGAFHPTSGGTIGANKAYLQVPSNALAAREMLTLSFDEGATAIRLTTSPTRDEGEWYDLSGRLLNSRPSAKGLYIYNGKKYVIR